MATIKNSKNSKKITKKAKMTTRRKVTAAIAQNIMKFAHAQAKKEGRKNIAAIARQFELSTVTVQNVLVNKYNYL